MLIEQAIFTSAETDRSAGYQLVAQSAAIREGDLRELSAWGPSHDSLLETGEDAVSINFHPLPSGACCVSRTTPAGREYSGRGGQRVYTQCLVVPSEVLARFGNNPFALLTATFAQGLLRVHERIPADLEPFRLGGKAAPVDQALLAQLLTEPGPAWLGAMVEAALSTKALALVAGHQRPRLIAGLINCLPPECRTRFSFSTGLKYSPRRPFRVISTTDDPAEQRRLLRQYEVTVLELAGRPPKEFTATAGWGGFVSCAIATGKLSFLAAHLAEPRPGLDPAHLGALGNQLLDTLARSTRQPEGPAAPPAIERPACTCGAPGLAPDSPAGLPFLHAEPLDRGRRADAPHERLRRAVESPAATWQATSLESEPKHVLGRQCPQAIEKLELLDDTVFEAIAGKPGSLEQLKTLWPELLAELKPDLVEESREQYVRHALNVWRECVDGDEIRNPAMAIAVMDVVCLLFSS